MTFRFFGLMGVWFLLAGVGPFTSQPQVKIGDILFQVEVVKTPREWEKGLMFREKLGDREGMLFYGTDEIKRTFWMKNTPLSLDIIFISKALRIVHIASETTPLSEKTIPSEKPAQYILEIKGGRAHALGIKPGDAVTFLHIP